MDLNEQSVSLRLFSLLWLSWSIFSTIYKSLEKHHLPYLDYKQPVNITDGVTQIITFNPLLNVFHLKPPMWQTPPRRAFQQAKINPSDDSTEGLQREMLHVEK